MSPPTTRRPTSAPQLAPRALTLIEMLIGMAITLVMMAAVVNLFANIGAGVRVRRAGMEMGGQLRQTRARLFKDLAGATCEARPKLRTDDHSDGYIEIVEGIYSDKNPSQLTDGTDTLANPELDYAASLVPSGGDPAIIPPLTMPIGAVTNGRALGDYDDILALTVRSESEPFVGRGLIWDPTANAGAGAWIDGTIESDEAEVIWFAVENPVDRSLGEPGMRTVYRRTLLIAPWIGPIDPTALANPMTTPSDPSEFFRRFDISARYDTVMNRWIPNTLADLVKRENRFGHFFDITAANRGFPHALQLANIRTAPLTDLSPLHPFGAPFGNLAAMDPDRTGEDVMLNNVLAFDLRVFDPGAPLVVNAAGAILEPSDFGWFRPTAIAGVGGYGSFVDLGWDPGFTAFAGELDPLFQLRHQVGWHPSAPTLLTDYPSVYDTGSFHYENDNIDQDGNGVVDDFTNGLDDDGINGTDDAGEREAPPPYDAPLRGIQVKLRIYEPDARLIREATVTRNFVPN